MTVEKPRIIGDSNIFDLGPRGIDGISRIIVAGSKNMTLEEAQSLVSALIFDGEVHIDLQPSKPVGPKI